MLPFIIVLSPSPKNLSCLLELISIFSMRYSPCPIFILTISYESVFAISIAFEIVITEFSLDKPELLSFPVDDTYTLPTLDV